MRSLWLIPLLFGGAASQDNTRLDCFPEPNSSQEECEKRGCTWTPRTDNDPVNMPYCYQKASQIGYTAQQTGDGQYTLTKNAGPKSPWGTDLQQLKLSYKDLGKSVINVRIETADKRFEPSKFLNLPRETIGDGAEKLSVSVNTLGNPFSFSVQRSDGRKLFDTSIGGLIFTEQFIQIATLLPSKNFYGLGEQIHPNLKHDFSRYTSWGMFARDEPPNSQGLDTKNLYGVHPFYLVMEPNGKAHGVLFLNANAQDVSTIPAPGLVYHTIGGILDIYFFPGPSPSDVIRQYHAFIGRPFLPAYWSLGYQMCRYGYTSLDDMKTRVEAIRNYKIPFDVAYADIDYMNRYKDFTTGDNWSAFGDYLKQMHEWGMHSILIFDPAIEVDYDSFQRGLESGAQFIEWERADEVQHEVQDLYPLVKDKKVMLSVVWPDKHVAFPDFLDSQTNTQKWWTDEFTRYHQQVPFDGAWIDMNEPSAFGTNEDHPFYYDDSDHPNVKPLKCVTTGADAYWDVPPYQTQAVYRFGSGSLLASKTLCMRAVTVRGSERFYNTKNLYGWSEAVATQKAVHAATGKRGAVITRSTFPSSGRYAGHWLGDNTATWQDLRSAVIGAMEMNFFGIPYVGSDVCGFNGASNEELCLRWQQLGSFHSFFRNHNSKGLPYQDPAVWPSVAAASKKANEFRYSMLPYLYSLHFRASLYGDTVIRPLFFEYPSDSETLSISEQFFWGPSILVAPVLYQGVKTVQAYVPSAEFYSLYDSNYGQKVAVGRSSFDAPTTYNTPTFVKAGSILPRQPANLTTVATRLGDFNLLVVPSDDASKPATGELFWDDGDSIVDDLANSAYSHHAFSYTLSSGAAKLSVKTDRAKAPSQPPLAYLEVFSFPSQPNYSSFNLNGAALSVDTQASRYNAFTKVATIVFSKPVDFSKQGELTITWNSAAASMVRTNRVLAE